MSIPIYRTPLEPIEWAPSRAEYSFRPEPEGAEPYAWVEPPPGWMLVGDPPLLVRRLDHTRFTTMTATDALYHALARAGGFGVAGVSEDGNPAALGVEVVGRSEPEPKVLADGRTTGRKRRGLPAPERNGRS